MKKTITKYDFERAFEETRPNDFSYAGLDALYKYFEEYEESTDIEIELDVIAICCEYTEYENLEEFNADYGKDVKSIEEISELTEVINIDDVSFIIFNY